MKSLSQSLILEKNKIASPNPWLILCDVKLSDATTLYLAKNNEDVIFQTRTYTAFPFDIEPTKEDSKGEIPLVSLRVSNITRVFQAYLEDLDGAVGAQVTITIVNAAYLSENYAELQMTFDILATSSDEMWVTFTLGAPNPLRQRFPLFRYIAMHCNWTYQPTGMTSPEKGRECNWATSRNKWVAAAPKKVGDAITPTTDNGHTYECTVAGTTGGSQPTWPTGTGATVVDNTVTWKETGITTGCKRTLEDCRRLANNSRFGGAPGLNNKGIRLR